MPTETRNYLPKLQALKNIIADPRSLRHRPRPDSRTSPTSPPCSPGTRELDVALAAKLAEMPVEEFMALNPGFSRPLIRARRNGLRIVLPSEKWPCSTKTSPSSTASGLRAPAGRALRSQRCACAPR